MRPILPQRYNLGVKKSMVVALISLSLGACDMFTTQPQLFPVWTPIPSRTPGILSPTPIIIPLTSNATTVSSVTPEIRQTPSPTSTSPAINPSNTPTSVPVALVEVDILGCNTSIDILHGMGEVTNAFVMVKNSGTVDLINVCSLLRAIDEDREHPDKRACAPDLPAQNQVTFKLTVDSAYRQDTAIQVDTSSNDVLLARVGKGSCTDIGVFGGAPDDLGVVKPIE